MVAHGFSFDPTAQWPWEPPGLGHREKSVNLFLNHPHPCFSNQDCYHIEEPGMMRKSVNLFLNHPNNR